MKNPQIVFLIVVIALALVFGGYLLAPPSSAPVTTSKTTTPAPLPADPSLVNNSDSPRLGKADAKLQVVLFSDYECPYCKDAHVIINDLLKKYPDQVSVVQRNFIVHPTSQPLAQASEAANLQGKYKEMNDALFASKVEPSEEAVTALAKDLGLNVDQFKSDLNSDKVKARVEKDNQDATTLGLTGTPSIFLNNQVVENFNNLPTLVQAQL